MSFDSSSTSPHKSLQAAMACLDLSLESELALYRRQTLQASSALALSDNLDGSISVLETDSEEGSLENLSRSDLSSSLAFQTDDSQEMSLTTLSTPAVKLPDIAMTGIQGPEIQKTNVQAAGPAERESAAFLGGHDEDPETLAEPYSAEAVANPEALERFLDPSIEDYLESSEALLKHLDDSDGTIAKPAKRPRQKVSPKSSPKKPLPQKSSGLAFKILGSVLAIALLVGIAMLILKQLTTRSRDPKPVTQSPIPSSLQPAVQTPSAPISASPAAIAITPLPLKPTSISSPKPTEKPDAAGEITPAPFYVVVAPYQDDASLQRARQLVPDAFIADIKGQRRIQLAFLDELQRAQRLVNDLKNEGFPATIVPLK
jgi:cell division septation protein DedD